MTTPLRPIRPHELDEPEPRRPYQRRQRRSDGPDRRIYRKLWAQFRAGCAARREPCHLCSEPILYSLHYPDPDAFELDHWTPVAVDPRLGECRVLDLAPRQRLSAQRRRGNHHRDKGFRRTAPRTAPSSHTCHNDPVVEGSAGAKLSPAVVEDLKNKGFNQSEIAEMYGVTRQYVSWIKHTYGGRLTPRELVNQHFPFEVPMEMGQTSPFKRLRDHGEYVATGGVGMSEGKLQRLRSFYRKLRDEKLVLEFDPSIPPIPGVSNKGGWAYRQRTPTDEDLLIRVNEYTDLTEEGRGIWRLPPVGP